MFRGAVPIVCGDGHGAIKALFLRNRTQAARISAVRPRPHMFASGWLCVGQTAF